MWTERGDEAGLEKLAGTRLGATTRKKAGVCGHTPRDATHERHARTANTRFICAPGNVRAPSLRSIDGRELVRGWGSSARGRGCRRRRRPPARACQLPNLPGPRTDAATTGGPRPVDRPAASRIELDTFGGSAGRSGTHQRPPLLLRRDLWGARQRDSRAHVLYCM